MKKNIALFAIAVAALMAVPAITRAQATTPAAPDASAPAQKHGQRIMGKVTAVDATAMAVTVSTKAGGTETYTCTSDTKITKEGQPATFADITVGTAIHGAFKKDGDKMTATMIAIGKGKKKAE